MSDACKKTTEALDGLIEEFRAVRKSESSKTGSSRDFESIEKIAREMHQSLQKLEADKKVWAHENALPLCQAVVKEMSALAWVRVNAGAYFFMEKVMGPVYTIAYNGVLADLKQQFPGDGPWRARFFCLLVDMSRFRSSDTCSAEKGKIDLLINNLTMFRDLFQRDVFSYSAPIDLIRFHDKCKCNEKCPLQEIKKISKFLLPAVEKMKQLLESDATGSNDDEVLRKRKTDCGHVIDQVIDNLRDCLLEVSVKLSSSGIHHMTM